jgi:hypothetical protein
MIDDRFKPHSVDRDYSVRALAKPKPGDRGAKLDKERLLKAYESSIK